MDQLTANTDFYEFLIASGACTREKAEHLAERSRASWDPLGMILVRRGILRMKQVAQILSAQAEEPRGLFGDVAVRLGLCTQAQVQDCLDKQRETSPHILDLALEDEEVDNDKIVDAMRAYIRHVERVLARLDDSIPDGKPNAAAA